METEMMEIKIDEIRTNPFQAREYFDEGKLKILADSIKEHGLDTPIQVVWGKQDDGKVATLKDGERRLRALKMAGYKKLRYGKEYIIIEVKDDAELEYRGLIANCMREDLQPGLPPNVRRMPQKMNQNDLVLIELYEFKYKSIKSHSVEG